MNFSLIEHYIIWKNNYLNVTRVSEADFLTSTWIPPKRLGSLSSVERISSKEKGAEPPLLPLIFAKICKIKIELIKRSFIFFTSWISQVCYDFQIMVKTLWKCMIIHYRYWLGKCSLILFLLKNKICPYLIFFETKHKL